MLSALFPSAMVHGGCSGLGMCLIGFLTRIPDKGEIFSNHWDSSGFVMTRSDMLEQDLPVIHPVLFSFQRRLEEHFDSLKAFAIQIYDELKRSTRYPGKTPVRLMKVSHTNQSQHRSSQGLPILCERTTEV
ncbi:hypothetical protein EJ05DRAFT_21529 [Pseudovirgaria hyperparasitica]|uniref:Uncharacterized protein n=1 Tax=Pseudovirgaria hyperparasitica TaxID=470096 RepID=A0A6A6WLB6_9PEZI|nr:uncharacterized protein EJ05DRAFT_21529 [Pseudovirgaria hyperparasitica]KAF2762948.1 hypothetical protein EJ05DRAFT_21529 [Pseudovirgaria hyperparasitica]